MGLAIQRENLEYQIVIKNFAILRLDLFFAVIV